MAQFADTVLAARLEGLCAAEMRRFVAAAHEVDPHSPAELLEVGGGAAAFVGSDSPVNQAMGLGFAGLVADYEIVELERFYVSRGARPVVQLCPHAHESLADALARRGWTLAGFENVLFREYVAGESFAEPPADIEIVEVLDDEARELWALVAATGFSYPLEPLEAQLALGRIVARRWGARLFLATIGGHAAGTGELYVEDRVAWLSADATLPQFRGRGVQQALQCHRLALGAQAGCEIAVSEAHPGSGSQRNMERQGFEVAYTRAEMAAPVAAADEGSSPR